MKETRSENASRLNVNVCAFGFCKLNEYSIQAGCSLMAVLIRTMHDQQAMLLICIQQRSSYYVACGLGNYEA